jgi:hypothetical protein
MATGHIVLFCSIQKMYNICNRSDDWNINMIIAIMDIIHHHVFYLKHWYWILSLASSGAYLVGPNR